MEIKLSSYFSNEELPIHLIQEITKTDLGMQFLERKQLTIHSKRILESPYSSTV